MLTPLATIISATKTLPKKRMYGEISYLSSRTPITRDKNDAKKTPTTAGVMRSKKMPGKKRAKNKGIPPPLGIGLVCKIAGCL